MNGQANNGGGPVFERNLQVNPQQFNQWQQRNVQGGGGAAGQGANLDAVQREAEEARAKETMTGLMANLSNFLGGRGMPAYNMADRKGFTISPEGQYNLQQETRAPMPFNDQLSSKKNLAGIVKSISPQMYGANEQVRMQLEKATPQLAKALGAKTQFTPKYYEGVPSNFYENRMNIYLQRRRENNLYAFI